MDEGRARLWRGVGFGLLGALAMWSALVLVVWFCV